MTTIFVSMNMEAFYYRPVSIALGEFDVTIFAINGSILGGAMSKTNRDK